AAVLPATVAVLGACLLVFVLWAVLADDPLGGEPVAVVAIDMHAGAQAGKSADATKSENAESTAPVRAAVAVKNAPEGSAASENHTVTIIDGTSGQRQEITVPVPIENRPVAAIDERLLEATRHGKIPRIGIEGTRVSEVYGRPVDPTRLDG